MKKIFKLLLVIILIFVIFALAIYETNKPRTISNVKSNDNKYSLEFIETESPFFFSASQVRIILRNEDKETYEINSEIYNDGKYLDESNWSVNWQTNYVDVILKGEEQSDEVITIYYIERKYKKSIENNSRNADNDEIIQSEDNIETPQENLDKMESENLIKIPNSIYGIIEMDHAMARSLWYFVEVSNNDMVFISEIPDTSPNIEAKIEKEKIVLRCEDVHGNIKFYESIDNGKTWKVQ